MTGRGDISRGRGVSRHFHQCQDDANEPYQQSEYKRSYSYVAAVKCPETTSRRHANATPSLSSEEGTRLDLETLRCIDHPSTQYTSPVMLQSRNSKPRPFNASMESKEAGVEEVRHACMPEAEQSPVAMESDCKTDSGNIAPQKSVPLLHTKVAPDEESGWAWRRESQPECIPISVELENRIKSPFPKTVALFYHGALRNTSSSFHESTWNWADSAFVKIPLSSSYHRAREPNVQKWTIICQQLELAKEKFPYSGLRLGKMMQSIVAEYHPFKAKEYNFKMLDDPAIGDVLSSCLPIIAANALQLETRLANPIPILKAEKPQTLLLSRNLCCSLLANAFFCTFPEEMRGNLPDFNFFRLFHKGENDSRSIVKLEKLKCILQYFEAVGRFNEADNTIISFERRYIPEQIKWHDSKAKLCPVHVERNKGIEDADRMLQVDFANKVVGGGVLNDGAVMEEIRFVTCPELIVARLFTEPLGNDEVLVVTGTRKFSLYSGYSSSFRFRGAFISKALVTDNIGREATQVVAMDAYQFSKANESQQYYKNMIERELHKCFVAFVGRKGNCLPVATGNWGCGAFNADPQLKFLIQWMAASQARRASLVYHTTLDEKQAREISEIVKLLYETDLTVDKLFYALWNYRKRVDVFSSFRMTFFDYLKMYYRVKSDRNFCNL